MLLELDPTATLARRQDRELAQADRFEDRAQSYHDAVVTAFDALASQEPERIHRVNAQGAAEDVTERMLAALADLLP